MTDPRRDVGRADAQPFLWTAGPVACLLIHGLTSTPFEVREVAVALHEQGHTVQALLLPGHGTRPEDLRRITRRDWTAAVERAWFELAQNHEYVFAVGISLGAALAVWLAATHLLQGVIGLGTPFRLRRSAGLARLLAYFRPLVPKKGGNSSLRDPQARAVHPSYGAMSMWAVAEMAALLGEVRPLLPRITAPALLIHAAHDSVIAAENATRVYEALGSLDKTLVWVHNSDHIITEDYDKQFVIQTVVEFVARLGPTGRQRQEAGRDARS